VRYLLVECRLGVISTALIGATRRGTSINGNYYCMKADGFYAAYFAGVAGNSFGIFVFKDGVIAGADAGGTTYDGSYGLSDDERFVLGTIQFTLPPGHTTITGVAASTEPIVFQVPIKLPIEFATGDVHRIETPAGPVNAKFQKLKSF
jgi:hypothetical protein